MQQIHSIIKVLKEWSWLLFCRCSVPLTLRRSMFVSCRCLLCLEPFTHPSSSWLMPYRMFVSLRLGFRGLISPVTLGIWCSRGLVRGFAQMVLEWAFWTMWCWIQTVFPGNCTPLTAWTFKLTSFATWADLSTSLAAFTPRLTPDVGSHLEDLFVPEVGLSENRTRVQFTNFMVVFLPLSQCHSEACMLQAGLFFILVFFFCTRSRPARTVRGVRISTSHNICHNQPRILYTVRILHI